MGIKTKWIGEVLLDAAQKGFIKSYQEFKTNFDSMIESGLWIEKQTYNKILSRAEDVFDS